jgi:hypothetical protein
MELLKYIREELRYQVPSYQKLNYRSFERTQVYVIDRIENATDDMKVMGNVVVARDPIGLQRMYIYNGDYFIRNDVRID